MNDRGASKINVVLGVLKDEKTWFFACCRISLNESSYLHLSPLLARAKGLCRVQDCFKGLSPGRWGCSHPGQTGKSAQAPSACGPVPAEVKGAESSGLRLCLGHPVSDDPRHGAQGSLEVLTCAIRDVGHLGQVRAALWLSTCQTQRSLHVLAVSGGLDFVYGSSEKAGMHSAAVQSALAWGPVPTGTPPPATWPQGKKEWAMGFYSSWPAGPRRLKGGRERKAGRLY